MTATLTATILPGLLCAAELFTVWARTHRAAAVLADVPALDGTLALVTLF